MILGNRQSHYGAVQVPEIDAYPSKIEFSGKWLSIRNALIKSLSAKYILDEYGNVTAIEDCVSQTLNFLIVLGATNDPEKQVDKIELWKEFVKMTPIYEGINIQLGTMMIKKHYPTMYENISKGQVYSHWNLTVVKECVLYTMEYLEKNKLLKNELDLIKRDNVKKWLKLEDKK